MSPFQQGEVLVTEDGENLEALANPKALANFRERPELAG